MPSITRKIFVDLEDRADGATDAIGPVMKQHILDLLVHSHMSGSPVITDVFHISDQDYYLGHNRTLSITLMLTPTKEDDDAVTGTEAG